MMNHERNITPRIKAILFDLDGTLRDTMEIVYTALEKTIEKHTNTEPTRDLIRQHIHHHSAVHAALSPQVDYNTWLQTYREYLGTDWMDAPFFDHAEGVLQELSMAGYRLAVVTAAEYERTIEYLSYRHIDQYFTVVTGMRDGFRPKPAPDLMLGAMQQLQVMPEEVIAIGDMITDIQAARAAGIECIGVTHGFATRNELEAAGADYLIDSFQELLPLISKMK